jgi:hypothetical protein
MMVPLDIIIFVLRHYGYDLLRIKFHKKMFEWFCIMKPDIIWRPLCFHWSGIKDYSKTIKPSERTKTTKSN